MRRELDDHGGPFPEGQHPLGLDEGPATASSPVASRRVLNARLDDVRGHDSATAAVAPMKADTNCNRRPSRPVILFTLVLASLLPGRGLADKRGNTAASVSARGAIKLGSVCVVEKTECLSSSSLPSPSLPPSLLLSPSPPPALSVYFFGGLYPRTTHPPTCRQLAARR